MTSDPIEVPAPDLGAAATNAGRRASLPPGCLGEFAPLTDAVAALRRSAEPPIAPRSVHLAVFAGDHGIAGRDVSADLSQATVRRASELAAGVGATAALARHAGVTVGVLDLAIDSGEEIPGIRAARVRRSSGSIDVEDALTHNEVAGAIQAGRDEANRVIDGGADLLIGGVCGVGAGTSAAAIASFLTGMEPVDVAGRGTGVDDHGWIRRVAAVRDARYRLTTGSSDAGTLLRVAGGADIAALTGFALQAAIRGVPVLLDDIPGAVAAVLAHRFAPGAELYLLAPALLPETVHRRLLDLLGMQPLTALRLGTGLAVPSLLLVPLIRMSAIAVDNAPAALSDRAAWAIQEWDDALL